MAILPTQDHIEFNHAFAAAALYSAAGHSAAIFDAGAGLSPNFR
jgi:hypothetical protein